MTKTKTIFCNNLEGQEPYLNIAVFENTEDKSIVNILCTKTLDRGFIIDSPEPLDVMNLKYLGRWKYKSKEFNLTIDQQVPIFKEVMQELLSWDDEQDKSDFILDFVSLYKQKMYKFGIT